MIGNIVIFGREFSSYAVMALIGALAAGVFCYLMAKRKKMDEVNMVFILLFAVIGVFIGGHLVYALTNIPYFYLIGHIHDWDSFVAIMGGIFGGQVFYGGLLGGIAAGGIAAKVMKVKPLGGYTDILACAVPLFHCFGRIGCFVGGCCYGVEWEHGITFHNSMLEIANGVPRFPVQLVEAGFNLLLFLFLLWMLQKGKMKHYLFFLYLAIYAVGRFILEFFRGDTYRGIWFGVSTSQIISILILLFCGVFGLYKLLQSRKARKIES